MQPISFLALIVVLLGAVCISSGYVIAKALNKLRTIWKTKTRKGDTA